MPYWVVDDRKSDFELEHLMFWEIADGVELFEAGIADIVEFIEVFVGFDFVIEV